MKKLILMAAIAMLCACPADAQRNGGRQRMTVEQQVSELKSELGLTSEQTKRVTALYTDFDKKMKSGSVSREQMRSERENLNKEIEKVLTDKQKATFQNMRSKRQGGRGMGNRK